MTADGYVVIYETVHGSRAYGIETEDSDLDLEGVMVGPRHWHHGFRTTPEQFKRVGARAAR